MILVNYYLGLQIQKFLHQKVSAKIYLFFAIIVNLTFLIYYKYWFFLLSNLSHLFGKEQPLIDSSLIPLGISFFTFHAISYNVDIFRSQAYAQKNPFRLALYFLFFPHLLAGPIVRYNSIVEQLKSRTIYFDDFRNGIERFIIGLAKKVLIADKLNSVVNEVFSIPTNHIGTPVAWVGIICFTLQLYFDFSGYTDMAIGLAAMFGFKFPENFNYPYISSSIREFWTRWHITLSNWIRDYLYYPLALKWAKGSRIKLYISLFITFALIGLWHGANWTYVVFGAIQGVALIFESIKNGSLFNRIPRVLKHVYFLLVLLVSWVFFRSENLTYALGYLKVLFGFQNQGITFLPTEYFLKTDIMIVIVVGVVCLTPIFYYLERLAGKFGIIIKFAKLIRLVGLFLLIAPAIAAQTYNPFLYFRF